MDDCMLSTPGGDGGGDTLSSVVQAFQGTSNALTQVWYNLCAAISRRNAKQNTIPLFFSIFWVYTCKNTASGLCGVLRIFVKTFVIGIFQETNQEAFLREVEGGYFVFG